MNKNYLRYLFLKPYMSWRNKYLKYITKREAEKFNLYNNTAREISEYTGESVDIVKQKHKLGPESETNFEIFKNQTELCKKDVEDFYKKCSYYLYELPLWNAERNRPKYLSLICLPYIRCNKYRKVMDSGAGSGDLCLELFANHLDVTYCDLSERLYNFAEWRFRRRKLPIRMIKKLEEIDKESFDCIFSFDTFEHIKDLPTEIKNLVVYIKRGGSLIFSGAFSGGTLHLEENDKYNDFSNLDMLMRNNGLTFQDKFAQFYFYKKQGDSRQ